MVLRLALNTGTFSLQRVDFLGAVQAISRVGFSGIDLRDNHIEDYIQEGHSVDEIKNLLRQYGLQPVLMNSLRDWQTWGNEGKEKYRAFLEHYLDQSRSIGCDCVICCAFAEGKDLERDIRSFREVCKLGTFYNIRMALEFLPWTGLREIRETWEVVRKANCSNGGLLIDSFHFFKGGSTIEDLRKVPTEKIFFVHLDDAPDLAMDVKDMCMTKRLFPGEGTFPLREMLDVLVGEKKYQDWVSLEILNQENQRAGYGMLAQRARRSLEKLLGDYGR